MTLVVDASALVWALTGDGPEVAAFQERLGREEVHSPHLIDAEAGRALRFLALGGHLPPDEAARRLDDGAALVDERYSHTLLSGAAWRLRDNLTFYDALYVALAEALELTLFTADRRLAGAPRLPCPVEIVG